MTTKEEVPMAEEHLILQRPKERVLTAIENAGKLARQERIQKRVNYAAIRYFDDLVEAAKRYYKLNVEAVKTMPAEELWELEQIIIRRARKHWILRKIFLIPFWICHAFLWLRACDCWPNCLLHYNHLVNLFIDRRALKRLVGDSYFQKILEARG